MSSPSRDLGIGAIEQTHTVATRQKGLWTKADHGYIVKGYMKADKQ